MLAAVLTLFFVFTFTGVAVLDLSSFTALENQDAVQSLKNQYNVESAVNVALWKINNVDSLAEYSDGYVTVAYDTTDMELVVGVDRYDKNYEVAVDLSEDHHFNRGIAARDSIIWNGHSAGLNDDRKHRKFNFLPEADLDYYLDNAVAVHSENFHTYSDDTLAPGIHVFTGSFISLENIKVQGTLVFTGRYVWLLGGNEVEAPVSAENSYAALVFTNDKQSTNLTDDEIKGPIYAKNKVRIHGNAKLSGPVVARTVELEDDINILDDENPQYYKWNNGFGNHSDYTWPKHIGRWRVTAS